MQNLQLQKALVLLRSKGEILGHDPLAQDRLMMEAQTSGVRPAREERGNR